MDRPFLQISEINQITPAKLYSIIDPQNKKDLVKTEHKPQLQGLGRKSINEIAIELGKDVTGIIEVLEKSGITANPDDTMKKIAENEGITPLEIWEIINK